MNNNLVKSKKINKVLHLTLNDQKNQNTLGEMMINTLNKKFKEASEDKDIKVIVLSSTGKVFCAGHNLKDLDLKRKDPDKGKSYYKKIFKSCSLLMMNIVQNPKPVIAAIDGVATAAGCQLIASCDLAYASNQAKFATPGARHTP